MWEMPDGTEIPALDTELSRAGAAPAAGSDAQGHQEQTALPSLTRNTPLKHDKFTFLQY